MSEVVTEQASTSRFLTRAEARRRGIPLNELLGPNYRKLFYDLYVPIGTTPTPLVRAAGALSVAPAGSYVSHHTAAEILGAAPPEQAYTHISTRGDVTRCRRDGIRAHRAMTQPNLLRRGALPVSAPTQILLEMAGIGTGLVDLVALGESLVRATGIPPERFVEAACRSTDRGAVPARRASRLLRKGVDSTQESRLRLLLVLAGLPEPEVNHILRRGDGEWSMRFDLCYPAYKLIVEYDGRQHADDPRQWRRDLQRREALDREDWRIIVVTAGDLYGEPEGVLIRVRDALVDRGARGVRRRFRPTWQQHFPQRVGN